MGIVTSNKSIVFINQSRGPVTASGLAHTIRPDAIIGVLQAEPTSKAISLTIPSSSSGAEYNITPLYITQSGNNPRVGLGTTGPLGSLDVRSDSSNSPADITLRTNEDGIVNIGEETGRIRFLIESSSFNINSTTTAISGASAEIFSRVNDVTHRGVKGSLVFALSKTTTSASIEAFTLGFNEGPPELATGDIHAVLSGSMAMNAEIPRIILAKSDGIQPLVQLGSVDSTNFDHAALILRDAAEDDNGYFVIRKDQPSYLLGNGNLGTGKGLLGIGTITASKTLEILTDSSKTDLNDSLSGAGTGSGVLIRNINDTNGTYANLDFRAHNADGRIAYQYKGVNNEGDFHFIVDPNINPTSRMVIQSDGNVGIGTTAPSQMLHISGASGKVRIEDQDHASNGTPQLYIEGNKNNALQSAATLIEIKSNLDVRGRGIHYTHANSSSNSIPSSDEWFSGVPYQGSGFQIGFDKYNGIPWYKESSSLFINEGGNVGIGTTSPGEKLHVVGNITSSGKITVGADGNGSDLKVFGEKANTFMQYDASEEQLTIKHPRDQAGLTIFTTSSGTPTGGGQIRVGRDGGQYIGLKTLDRDAHFIHRQDETDDGQARTYFEIWDSSHPATGSHHWAFRSADGSGGNLATRMLISSSGNVGIGTTSPTRNLEVSGVSSGEATYIKVLGDTSQEAILELHADNNAAGDRWRIASSNSAKLQFRSNGSNTVTFTGGGNVGIGTTTPGEKLEVIGNISASGAITASNIQVANDIALGGNIFSFSGFSFIEGVSANFTGSNKFGSGSTPSSNDIAGGGTAHQFTGSVAITGSGLTIVGSGGSVINIKDDTIQGPVTVPGGLPSIALNENGFDFNQNGQGGGAYAAFKINSTNENVDFRVDGKTVNNLLKVSASDSRVEIRNSLSVLGDGHITASGDVNVTGTGSFGYVISNSDISASGDVIGDNAVFDNVRINALTEGLVTFATTNGLLTDDDDFAFNTGTDTLSVTNIANVSTTHVTASGNISASGAVYASRILPNGPSGPYIDETAAGGDIFLSTGLYASTNITASNNISASGDIIANHITASGNISASGTIFANRIHPNGPSGPYIDEVSSRTQVSSGFKATTEIVAGTNITASGDISASGNLLGGGITINGNSTFNSDNITLGVDDSDRIHVNGFISTRLDCRSHITASGNISASGNIICASASFGQIYDVNDDGDTLIDFPGSNNVDLYSAGRRQINVQFSSIRINHDGNDVDFIVEGNTDQYLIYTDASTDQVGIGVLNPTAKLDVDGNINTNSHITASGVISSSKVDTEYSLFAHSASLNYVNAGELALPGISNVSASLAALTAGTVGDNLGNHTATEDLDLATFSIKGITNITASGVISSSKDALINSLTIGRGGGDNVFNTAIGNLALLTSTDSNQDGNTAVGASSMQLSPIGKLNTAVGWRALYQTKANNNTSIGQDSLYNHVIGDNNVALGLEAGKTITGGSTALYSASNSTFIGMETKAKADDETNQIVIGYDATGEGSNSVVLGNDNITKTVLKGNITASGIISSSGDILTSDDITALGTINGKLRYHTHHNMEFNSSAQKYIPINNISELTSIDKGRNTMIAPYDGKLVSVKVLTDNDAGASEINLNVNGVLGSSVGTTAVGANTVVTIAKGTSFSADDILAVNFNPGNNPGDVSMTCLWEYDTNT